MKEQLSTSTQKPKIELPNKELVGVKTTKQKQQDLKSESAKLPIPTGWRILVLPFKQKEKTKGTRIFWSSKGRIIMPFKSEKQRRYLWKKEPAIARKWTKKYGSKPVKKTKRRKK